MSRDRSDRQPRAGALFVIGATLPLVGFAYLISMWAWGPPPKASGAQIDRALRVTQTRPGNTERGVLPNAFVAADVHLPNTGHGIDAGSLTPQSVKLYRTSDRSPVAAVVNTSGAGDAIVLQPVGMLQSSTSYTFEVTEGLRDTSGAAFQRFKATFTTAAGAPLSKYPVAFERVTIEPTQEVFTALTIGPDGLLYAATFDGKILRYPMSRNGMLAAPHVINTVQSFNQGPRLITGIRFDPASPADDLVLWVSHGVMALENAPEWTGKISRLRGSSLSGYEDVVVNLPRGYRDHLNNQLDFGPDGAIYFCQGSMTATGAPDQKWNFRPERKLSAAVLRLDAKALDRSHALPLDVKTEDGGTYDPFAPGAPLTIYASGVRVGFDLLWHSSGRLYVPINGSAKGGNAPASIDGKVPALEDVSTQPDYLLNVVRGGYYGHPNPARNEFVLNGGNPTGANDPGEMNEYPVGVAPQNNWRRAAYDFGRSVSPNGVIEYKSNAFGGRLRGKLLVTRYSGGDDVIVLTVGAGGDVTESLTGIDGFTHFVDPLDLVEDPRTGNLYVAEFGGQKLSLLRPIDGGESREVFRQIVK